MENHTRFGVSIRGLVYYNVINYDSNFNLENYSYLSVSQYLNKIVSDERIHVKKSKNKISGAEFYNK